MWEEIRVLGENTRRHRDNMQNPHRNAPTRIRTQDLLAARRQCYPLFLSQTQDTVKHADEVTVNSNSLLLHLYDDQLYSVLELVRGKLAARTFSNALRLLSPQSQTAGAISLALSLF